MRILDTKKAKEERDAEREMREFEEWLRDGVSSTAPPSVGDLKGLFDGHGGHSTATPGEIKKMMDDLLRKMDTVP